MIQAVLENGGNRAEVLPVATREDLLTGREVADIDQCCPTSFTTGNLVNFVRKKSQQHGAEETAKRYVYLTAGACGACRFGQYHQSYELGLRNAGLDAFRMFLLDQEQLNQESVAGGGLALDVPMTLGCLWGIFCTDLVQDLEYQVRPYEVVPGRTDAVVRESVELLYEIFRRRPRHGPWRSIAWHLTTSSFTKALREIHKKFSAIEVDRLRVKPSVKITGEFYLQTVEGDPNYNIHRWLEGKARRCIRQPSPSGWTISCAWGSRDSRITVASSAGLASSSGWAAWPRSSTARTYNRLRRAMGNLPHELPSQFELRRLAAPYFHSRLDGGEGDMLVGKALWAHQHKKAHMICELSPYACMPNTMSVGAMAGVIGKHPDLLYAPLEIKGDAEVHALSRCQMILTEARKRAQKEFEDALARTGLTLAGVRGYVDAHPELKRATYRVPHGDAAGTAANLVLHVATLMRRGRER